MASLAGSSDQGNKGLWPTDKPLYDSSNRCELQGPSKDKFDANGAQTIVRSSSSEGMWETSQECCQHLWCSDKCDEYAQSQCEKPGHNECESSCGSGGEGGSSHHHHGQTQSDCITQKGYQYCGEDCTQAKEEGFGCWSEKDCSEVDGDGVPGQRYFAKLAVCCVDYTALNGQKRQNPEFDEDTGSDDTLTRCANDPEFQRRQTDYPIQEPEGAGGYIDRGEFPSPAEPNPLPPGPALTTGFVGRHSHRHSHHPHGHPPSSALHPHAPASPNHPAPQPTHETRNRPNSHMRTPSPQAEPRSPGRGSPNHPNPFGMHHNHTVGVRDSPPMRTIDEVHGPRGHR